MKLGFNSLDKLYMRIHINLHTNHIANTHYRKLDRWTYRLSPGFTLFGINEACYLKNKNSTEKSSQKCQNWIYRII